jgi:23S rRNA pseudouridine2605 synthase
MPGSPTARSHSARSPYSGDRKPYAGKRDGDDRPPRRDFGDAPRPRGDRPFASRPSRGDDGEKRRSSRVKIVAVATSARSSRAVIVRISIATTARRAGIDRRCASGGGVSSDRKFGDRKPYTPREGGGEKRPYTPRGEGFRKDGDRPRGDRPFSARPSRDGDRPRGDRPERKFGGNKKFSRGAPDRGPRKDFGDRPDRGRDRGDSKPGRSARIAASVIPVPPVTVRGISTSRASTSHALTGRATTAAATSVRAFRVRARIARI